MDMRRVDPEDKRYSVERLWEHHQEIIRLLVASNGGFTNAYIARQVGCTPQTVSNVRNNPIAMAKIQELEKERDESAVDLSKRVKEIAPLALNLLQETIGSSLEDIEEGAPDPKLLNQGVRSAIAVVEHSVPKRVEKKVVHGHFTFEQIAEAKKRALASHSRNPNEVRPNEVRIEESVEDETD